MKGEEQRTRLEEEASEPQSPSGSEDSVISAKSEPGVQRVDLTPSPDPERDEELSREGIWRDEPEELKAPDEGTKTRRPERGA